MIPKSGKIKAFKFQFDILIEKVELAITFPCQISITWKRGNQKIETKNKAVLDTTNFIAVFNENLSMMTNLYFEETKNLFLEKKSVFTIIIAATKGNKIAGVVNVDLANYINNKVTEKVERLKLEKCPDKNAKLHYTIKTNFIGEVKDFDLMSQNTSKMEEELEYEINDAPITNTGSLKSSHKIGQKDNSEENNMGPSTEKEKLPINSDSETKKKSLLAGMTGIEEEKTYLIQKLSEKNEEIKKNIFIIEKQEKNHKELLEELEKYKGMEGSITNYKMMIENMNAEKELLREKVSLSENEQRNLQEEIKQQQLKIKEQEFSLKLKLEKEKAISSKNSNALILIENDLKEKTEKIDLLTKELQQSRLIIQKNEAEFEQKLKNLGQDFELKINELTNFNASVEEKNKFLLEKNSILEQSVKDLSKILGEKNSNENNLKSEFETQNSELIQENSNLNVKISDLKGSLDQSKMTMIGLEAQITELNLHMISKTSENEQIHQKIQSQIQEKQEEWNSLEKKYKSQIDLLENEKKEKESKIQSIVKNLENSLKESEEKLKFNQNSKESSNLLEKVLEESKKRNDALTKQLEYLQEKYSELEENHKNLEEKINMEEKDYQNLTQEIENLQEKNKEKDEKIKNLEPKILDLKLLNDKFNIIEEQLQEKAEKLAYFHKLNEEYNNMQKQLQEKEEKIVDLNRLTEERSQIQAELENLNVQITQKEENIIKLEEKIKENLLKHQNELETETNQLNLEIKKLTIKNEDLNDILQRTKEELITAQQDQQTLYEKMSKNEENEFFKSQILEKEALLHSLNLQLEKNNANYKDEILRIENENEEQRKLIEQLKQKIEENNETVQKISIEKEEFLIEINQLNQRNEEMRQEIEEIQKLKAKENEFIAFKEEISQKEVTLSALRSEISKMKETNDQLNSTLNNFQIAHIAEIKQHIEIKENLEKSNEDLQKTLTEITSEAEILRGLFRQKDNIIQELRAKLSQTQAEFNSLQSDLISVSNNPKDSFLLQKLESEKADLTEKLDEKEILLQRAEQTLNEKNLDFEILNNKLELKDIDLQELAVKLDICNDQIAEYQASLDSNNAELISINEKCQGLTESIKNKEEELISAQKQMKELESQMKNLEKNIAELSTLPYQLELRECEKNNLDTQLNNMLRNYEKLYTISKTKLIKEDIELHEKEITQYKHQELEKRGSIGEISNQYNYNDVSGLIKESDTKVGLVEIGFNEEEIRKLKNEIRLKEDVLLKKTEEFHELQNDINNENKILREENQRMKNFEDYKDKFGSLEKKYNSLEKDFIAAKLNWAKNDEDSDKLKAEQRRTSILNNKIKELEVNISQLENELLRSKQKLGDAINAAQEFGGSELVDRIASAIMNI